METDYAWEGYLETYNISIQREEILYKSNTYTATAAMCLGNRKDAGIHSWIPY